MNKYTADDAWDTIEEFYGDELESNDQEFVSKVEDEFANHSFLNSPNEQVEYGENFQMTLIDDKGNRYEYEMVGRIDVEGKTYLLVHNIADPNPSTLSPLRAWDDENGQMQLCDIDDDNEFNAVMEMVRKLMTDDPDAEDIEGGGVQWDE